MVVWQGAVSRTDLAVCCRHTLQELRKTEEQALFEQFAKETGTTFSALVCMRWLWRGLRTHKSILYICRAERARRQCGGEAPERQHYSRPNRVHAAEETRGLHYKVSVNRSDSSVSTAGPHIYTFAYLTRYRCGQCPLVWSPIVEVHHRP